MVVHKSKARYDVYIGRPSKWGNPFSHLDGTLAQFKVPTREIAIVAYAEWLMRDEQRELRDQARRELRGKVLGCWCKPKPCHGDILVAVANTSMDAEVVQQELFK